MTSIINVLILDSADTIEDDQQISYIDLDYYIPDAPGAHVIITSRSSIAKEMTTLEAVEVADMKPPEAVELFQRYAGKGPRQRDESGSNRQRAGILSLGNCSGRFIRIGDDSLVM